MQSKIFFLIIVLVHCLADDQLTQVLVLGRHNIRTPLVDLDVYTSKEWPKWAEVPGALTTKGALLEEYLGEYFSDYWRKENLLTNECPGDNTVHIYAIAEHRARKSAKHFARTAFKMCNITIHLQSYDYIPFFLTIVLNETEDFQTMALKVMQDKLDEFNLTDVYTRLNSILDIENSDLCKVNNICDLTTGKNYISVNIGEEPTIFGPFKAGYEVVDGLLMAYYDGHLMSNIGWGQVQPEDWPVLMKMTKADQKLRFGCPEIAKHIAKPLLGYIDYVFKESKHNINLLVGDDSNIMSILASIGVKPYDLEDQPEMAPIGGKVIFEKWYNGLDYYLKMKYVYLSTEQIRDGSRISVENPARETNLELQDAIVNEQGHCTFAQFMKILDNVL